MLLICALFVGREYNRYIERRIGELFGFVAFLNHAKGEISMFLTPTAEILRGFKNDSLDKLGFISEAGKTGSLGKAFSECEERASIGKEAKQLLAECFSGFGQGYREQEITRIEHYVGSLGKILETERDALPKNARMVSALLLAGAVGIFILLL